MQALLGVAVPKPSPSAVAVASPSPVVSPAATPTPAPIVDFGCDVNQLTSALGQPTKVNTGMGGDSPLVYYGRSYFSFLTGHLINVEVVP